MSEKQQPSPEADPSATTYSSDYLKQHPGAVEDIEKAEAMAYAAKPERDGAARDRRAKKALSTLALKDFGSKPGELDEFLEDTPDDVIERLTKPESWLYTPLRGEGTAEDPYTINEKIKNITDVGFFGEPKTSIGADRASRGLAESGRTLDQRADLIEEWAGLIHESPDKVEELAKIIGEDRGEDISAEQLTPRTLAKWGERAKQHLENVNNIESKLADLRRQVEEAEADLEDNSEKTYTARRFTSVVNGEDAAEMTGK